MLDHLALSVPPDKFQATVDFYVASLAPLGYEKLVSMLDDKLIALGNKSSPMSNTADFWLSGMSEANVDKNYAHWAFVAEDHSKVDAFYANAIQAGGRDNEPQASAHILVRTIMLHL